MSKSVALLLVLVFLIASNIATPLPVKAEPKTIVVPDDFPTIQEAIDNASAGDTVFVRKGTYYYRGSRGAQGIIINKTLSLIGEDSQNTILQVEPSDYRYVGHHEFSHSAISIMADNVTISGFTIDGAWYNVPYTLSFSGPTFYIEKRSGVDWGIITWDSIFSSDSKISGNNMVNFLIGAISIREGQNHEISGNRISDSDGGIGIQAINTVISQNTVSNVSDVGISVSSSGNLIVKQNNIVGNGRGGLSLSSNGSCYVYENNITGNFNFGVQFERSNNIAVYNNNINGNDVGIYLRNSRFLANATMGGVGNKVYYNNIVNNTENILVQQALSYYITNTDELFVNGTDVVLWDNGYVGNYWSDYQSKYPDAAEVDASGIGDTPYVIDENNKDRYPLFELLRFEPLRISVLSPLAQTYNETSVPLVFTIRGKWVNWTGYSLDGKETITVAGNTTLTGLSNGSHNVTVYAKDLVDAEASDTVWFNVEEPFPTMLVIATVVTVAIVGVGLLVYFKKRER